MSSYIRPSHPGATVFFTVRLAEIGSTLLVDEIDRLRAAFHATLMERWFVFDAVVVLPDHLHAVITLPPGDGDYATRWRCIKTRFSRGLPMGQRRDSHLVRRERGIWQRRYWEHHIRDDADYAAHVQYCWSNPVKHGLAKRPRDWPFSSLHRDIQSGRARGCLFGNPVFSLFSGGK